MSVFTRRSIPAVLVACFSALAAGVGSAMATEPSESPHEWTVEFSDGGATGSGQFASATLVGRELVQQTLAPADQAASDLAI